MSRIDELKLNKEEIPDFIIKLYNILEVPHRLWSEEGLRKLHILGERGYIGAAEEPQKNLGQSAAPVLPAQALVVVYPADEHVQIYESQQAFQRAQSCVL